MSRPQIVGALSALLLLTACGAEEASSSSEPRRERETESESGGERAAAEPEAEEPAAPTEARDVAAILAAEDHFSWTDGTSIWTLYADQRFELSPTGMSGRSVTGRWRLDDGQYEVIGQWGWDNGISRTDDFRRLRFTLRPPHTRVPADELMRGGVVYRSFFLIESLAAITPEEHAAGFDD